MGLLFFGKTEKIRSTEEHNKMYSSSAEASGTYEPNMSERDKLRWKAKHIKGKDERIEIRKTMHGISLVIVVSKNLKNETINPGTKLEFNSIAKRHVQISINGKLQMNFTDYEDFQQAIREAIEILSQ